MVSNQISMKKIKKEISNYLRITSNDWKFAIFFRKVYGKIEKTSVHCSNQKQFFRQTILKKKGKGRFIIMSVGNALVYILQILMTNKEKFFDIKSFHYLYRRIIYRNKSSGIIHHYLKDHFEILKKIQDLSWVYAYLLSIVLSYVY